MSTERFKNKYRIASARASWHRYDGGIYFVTICTQDKKYYFGEVLNGKMNLSKIGIIADILWHEIKNHAPNIELGEFVVMPNHIHGILILNGNDDEKDGSDDDIDGNGNDNGNTNNANGNNGNDDNEKNGGNDDDAVETTHALSLQFQQSGKYQQSEQQTIEKKRFQNQGKNTLSAIIGSYKSAVSKHTHRLGFCFEWQSRFHDHIIRNEQSYQTISEYIINNPLKWSDDKFYPMNKNLEK
ncbi:MAG: hypothetical protein Q4F97_00860 [Bacteroidales bacterium]|nr:hypothetical protein [Bacteroidales bacterium]